MSLNRKLSRKENPAIFRLFSEKFSKTKNWKCMLNLLERTQFEIRHRNLSLFFLENLLDCTIKWYYEAGEHIKLPL